MKVYEMNLFDKVNDPVKTEQTIYQQLLANKEKISTDRVYVALPIADRINKFGIPATQKLIFSISNSIKKPFYVSQHILTNHLNFGKNALVFSTHATKNDNLIPIPHFSVNVSPIESSLSGRKWEMSFQGAFRTHWTRMKLYDVLKDRNDCFIKNTGEWFFEKKQKQNFPDYKELLSETKIALCPRGTGPSSIRFWEAMGSGCVPLLISDNLKLPFENEIDWDRIIIKVPENKIEHIDDYIPDEMTLHFMAMEGKKLYKQNFSNTYLSKAIIEYLKTEGIKKNV